MTQLLFILRCSCSDAILGIDQRSFHSQYMRFSCRVYVFISQHCHHTAQTPEERKSAPVQLLCRELTQNDAFPHYNYVSMLTSSRLTSQFPLYGVQSMERKSSDKSSRAWKWSHSEADNESWKRQCIALRRVSASAVGQPRSTPHSLTWFTTRRANRPRTGVIVSYL